jgi:hypothetical protein
MPRRELTTRLGVVVTAPVGVPVWAGEWRNQTAVQVVACALQFMRSCC